MKNILISVLVLAASAAVLCGAPLASSAPKPVPDVPVEVLPIVQLAKTEFEQGSYREAEGLYKSALLIEPFNVFILSSLAVVQFKLGEFRSSDEMFKKVMAAAPQDIFSCITLAAIYYQQARYDDALAQIRAALTIEPKNEQALATLRMLQESRPDFTSRPLLF